MMEKQAIAIVCRSCMKVLAVFRKDNEAANKRAIAEIGNTDCPKCGKYLYEFESVEFYLILEGKFDEMTKAAREAGIMYD